VDAETEAPEEENMPVENIQSDEIDRPPAFEEDDSRSC
jgi:hypothetical protein